MLVRIIRRNAPLTKEPSPPLALEAIQSKYKHKIRSDEEELPVNHISHHHNHFQQSSANNDTINSDRDTSSTSYPDDDDNVVREDVDQIVDQSSQSVSQLPGSYSGRPEVEEENNKNENEYDSTNKPATTTMLETNRATLKNITAQNGK